MEELVQPAFQAPDTTVLPPFGECLYCGSKEDGLTKEHILPNGLNGSLLLPKSSCKRCQAITSLIEQKVLKGFLYESRLTLGMRSNDKRWERPKFLKITFTTANGGSFKKDVPLSSVAVLLMLPMFVAPKYLATTAPFNADSGIDIMDIPNAWVGNNIADLVRRHGAVGIKGKLRIDVPAFVRVLSKIAYAYHVAIHGAFPREESPALAVMFGERSDMGTWVGCREHTPLNGHSNVWHDIAKEETTTLNGHPCTLVHITLFDQLRPCTYSVITRAPGWRTLALQ